MFRETTAPATTEEHKVKCVLSGLQYTRYTEARVWLTLTLHNVPLCVFGEVISNRGVWVRMGNAD